MWPGRFVKLNRSHLFLKNSKIQQATVDNNPTDVRQIDLKNPQMGFSSTEVE